MKEKIESMRKKEVKKKRMLIKGRWKNDEEGNVMEVIQKIEGKKMKKIEEEKEIDVESEEDEERKSFEKGKWEKEEKEERRKVILKIEELIERKEIEIEVMGVRENGKEIQMELKEEKGSDENQLRY